MSLNTNDYIGFTGVFVLLVAYLLNLTNTISRDGLPYLLMNLFGAGLSGIASWLIHYIPFVILEASWTLVSLVALVNYLVRSRRQAAEDAVR